MGNPSILVNLILRALRAGFRSADVLVLSLHSVSTRQNHVLESMHPADLEGLIVALRKDFQFSNFTELGQAAIHSGRPRVVLTFDDGYADFLDYAMPILDRYRIRANLNVVTDSVKSGVPFWNIRLYDFLTVARPQWFKGIALPGLGLPNSLDNLEERRRFARTLIEVMKPLSKSQRVIRYEPLWRLMEKAAFQGTSMMRQRDVREVAAYHDIGAHSCEHLTFAAEDDARFVADIGRCESFFVGELALPMRIYAFPNGSHKKSQLDWLVASGKVKEILLVEEELNRVRDGHPPRTYCRKTVYGNSVSEITLRALAPSSLMRYASKLRAWLA